MIVLLLLQTHLNVENCNPKLMSLLSINWHNTPTSLFYQFMLDLETFIDYVGVEPTPLVTYPKSTTQLVFTKSKLHNVFSIAFIKINRILITPSLENQVGVTYN
jgi:hypothetical protein